LKTSPPCSEKTGMITGRPFFVISKKINKVHPKMIYVSTAKKPAPIASFLFWVLELDLNGFILGR
jgi:hypothetical protein